MKRLICLFLVFVLFAGFVCVNAEENSTEAEAEDTQQGMLIDDCIDFSVVTDHSEGVYPAVTEDENKAAFDDYTMFMRSTSAAEWVEYAVPESQYLIFNTYFRQNEEISHFTFLWSSDKEEWTEFQPAVQIMPVESWRWIPVTYNLKNIADAAKYVRIIFGNIGGTVWSPSIASVYSRYNAEGDKGFVDCIDTSFYDATAFLKNLGFVTGVTEYEFKPYNSITRAEFAKLTAAVLNIDTSVADKTQSVFKDISGEHWAFDSVTALYNLGIIHGDENGFFNPSDTITLYEGTKILVSALGYSEFSEEKGGYPSGYRYMGKQLDILDGVFCEEDGLLNRGTAAVLLANTLNSEVVYRVGFGGSGEFKKDGTTILNKYHSIFEVEGVLTDSGAYSILSDSLNSENIAVINGEKYKTEDFDVDELLGHEVIAYVKQEKDDTMGAVLFAEPNVGSGEIQISAENYLGLNDDCICYKKSGKEDKIKCDKNTRVILNGRYDTRMGMINQLDFTCGNMSIIQHRRSNAADVILIWNYQTHIMKSDGKLSGNLTDETGKAFNIELDKAEKIQVFVYGDEKEYNPDITVKAGDVLSIAQSKDKCAAKIYITEGTLKGTLTKIYDDCCYIGNTQVYFAAQLSDTDISSMLGQEIVGYIDINGRIAYVDLNGLKQEYGYIQTVFSGDSFSQKVFFRIITQDGRVKEYHTTSKTRLNGRIAEFKDFSGISPQLVRFISDENDTITEIETADVSDGTVGINSFVRNYKSARCKYHGDRMRLFASVYQVDGNTKIFVIPEDRTKISEYDVTDVTYLLNDKYYDIELYDTDKSYMVNAMVLYLEGSESRTLESYDNIAVVTDSANILDSEGRLCLEVMVKVNGQDMSVYFDNQGGTDTTGNWLPEYILRDTKDGNNPFKKGEVFQYYMDGESHCRYFRMMLTDDMINKSSYYERNLGDYGILSQEIYFSELYTMFGIVKDKFADKFIAEAGNGFLRTFSYEDAVIYRFNSDTKKILTGSKADISVGSDVFVRMNYTAVKEIIVIE